MATVGKNILDNLTTGMYSDSKVIFREYIQNACDQIDIALRSGIIDKNDAFIDIYTDARKRYISIRDNATGVKHDLFAENLGDIANSNKELGKDKGFRGIGRLCGLAYCRTLRFSTSYPGENVKSIMTCDAKRMREMLLENRKYTLDDIWAEIVTFSTDQEESDAHYFEVELIDINKENTDLLDDKKVKEYLSFVAPVPYKNTFILRNQIYEHAKEIGCPIDEYRVKHNGSQVFKDYTTRLKEQNGASLKNYDEISRLEFHDFIDENGRLIAWMWVGLSRFEKQIPKVNQMRGLRLRSGNIQLGDDDVLQELFKEPRGNYYFVGEVFAIDKGLIPNSQRNYFNENETRILFEDLLRAYFFDVLHRLYYDANKIKNAYKRQEEYIAKADEFSKKAEDNGFVNEEERQKLQYDVEKAKKEAEDARKQLKKYDDVSSDSPIAEVHKSISKKYDSEQLKTKAEATDIPDTVQGSKKDTFVTSKMSKLSRGERKLVSKILTIITEVAPKDVSEKIIERIKEELK